MVLLEASPLGIGPMRTSVHTGKHADTPIASRMLLAISALLFISLIERGYAQPSQPPIAVQPNIAAQQAEGHVFKIGEPCKQMTGKAGIIKRDACQRWYCSRPEYQDITERRPNFATEIGCEWQLVGVHCLCRKPGTAGKEKK
jgi:hypothetical protein